MLPPHPAPTRSTDLTEGVRASARALANAEQGIRAAGNLAGRTVVEQLPKAQGALQQDGSDGMSGCLGAL